MADIKVRKLNPIYLDVLEDTMKTYLVRPISSKPIKMHYYNLICIISQIYQAFILSSFDGNLSIFFIEYYMKKYQNRNQLERNFFGLISCWKKNLDKGDALIYASILQEGRNCKEIVKLFMKLRKTILKNLNFKILQEIHLSHEDSLTIVHTVFQEQTENFIAKKLNQLYISLKRKYINNAKINGAVAIEFFINCIQQRRNSDLKNNKGFQPTFYDVQPKKPKIVCPPKIQKPQPLCNLSFSEQYADFYNSQKKKEHYSVQKQLEYQPQQSEKCSSLIQSQQEIIFEAQSDYPQGWEDFIRTNKLLKQKLLHHGLNAEGKRLQAIQ